MNKQPKYLIFLSLILVIASSVYYVQNNRSKNASSFQNEMQTFIFNKENQKVEAPSPPSSTVHMGQLIFINGAPKSTSMAEALLCSDHSSSIEKVDLYMPDMGHGSQPPTVAPEKNIPKELQFALSQDSTFACLSIKNMQLFMPGLWQVRAFYNDGTVGVFNVNLKE